MSSGLDTARALTLTQVAAASGALGWMIIEGIHHGKATSLGFVSGMLTGLVVITPAAGVVSPLGAFFLGLISTPICYISIILKNRLGYDDTLDVFGIHAIAGIVGAIALVFFLRSNWIAAQGEGWSLIHQLGVQSVAVVVAIVYAAVVTLIITFILQKTMGFRTDEADEIAGLDHSQHAECGYGLINIE